MAIAITTTVSWGSNYAFASWFPLLSDGPLSRVILYAIMGISCLAAFGFTYRFVPETMDRTLEECVAMVLEAQHTPVVGGQPYDEGDDEVEGEEDAEEIMGQEYYQQN
jgi:hypothetical protein